MKIKTLRNIDIKQILQYLKTINVDQIREVIQTRPDIIIKVVLIGLTLFFSARIIGGYSGTARQLKNEITQMQDKLNAIEESKKIQKQYDDFIRNFPESILPDQLISKLSEFAAQRNVQILSFNPAKEPREQSDEFMELAGVEIHVASERYEDLVLFVKDIEDAPYTMRVDNWSGRLLEQRGPQGRGRQPAVEIPEGQNLIEATMEIGSVKLKNGL